MTVSALPATGQKIEVIDTIEASFRRVFANWQTAAELAWLPYLIVLVTQLVPLAFGSGRGMIILAGLIRSFGFLVFGTIFIARWHRFVLLGETQEREMFGPPWQGVFFVSLKLTLFIVVGWVILVWIALLPPHVLTVFFPIVGGIALLVISVRYGLVFPAAAIERPLTFKGSWDMLQGNTWRLFAAAGICYVPFALLRVGLAYIAGGDRGWVVWFVCQVLGLGLSFLIFAIIASLLSLVYRQLTASTP